jgi:uncharacterized protein involved in exopolysaccharide biosynthesis
MIKTNADWPRRGSPGLPETIDRTRGAQEGGIDVLALSGPSSRADEIDLFAYGKLLWRGRLFIAAFTIVCTLAAVFLAFFVLPVTYKSEAVLMPTETQGGGMLAGLMASLPIPIGLPMGEKADSIMAFLNSRILKERLLVKYDLLPRLYKKLWNEEKMDWLVDDAEDKPTVVLALQEEALRDISQVSQDKKTNLITISWVDEDPAFAASMLERVISELRHYLDHEYETDAKREREFVEQQLAQATAELERWEQRLPAPSLPLAKIQRERLAAQTVYAELRKQLALARISEAKELIRFKVLDPPLVPVKKFKPKRALICAMALIGSGIVAAFLVIVNHAIELRRAEMKN